ncbi:MAG TPA: DUF3052 family protein [Longilinea sp.]|nr:DUF3052 family protein [Longilinea sp.]
MSDKTIAQKLMVKAGQTVLILNAPKGYKQSIGKLPIDAALLSDGGQPADIIQAFIYSKTELEDQLSSLKTMLKPKGILWITYPKGTGKIHADINRDSIRSYALTAGLEAVAIFSVDDDWAALRLKSI